MPGAPVTSTRSDNPPNSRTRRHPRTRNGCERCRAQHRKCDETKPECKRCIGAGATCQYITRTTFLNPQVKPGPVNNAPGELKSGVNKVYTAIRFVNDNLSFQQACGSSVFSDHGRQPKMVKEISKYPQRQSNHSSVPNGENSSKLLGENMPFGHPQVESEDKELDVWPIVGHSPLSLEEIRLLKSYIHIVAPCLDIYDDNNIFRHQLTAIAMNSPCILEKTLRLSAAITGRPSNLVKPRGVVSFRLRSKSVLPLAAIRLMGSFALDRALFFAESTPNEWDSGFYQDHLPPIISTSHSMDTMQQHIWCGILALIARLEIAASLVNQTSSMTSHALLDRIISNHNGLIGSSQSCFYASMCCLALLSEVMKLCLPELQETKDFSSGESISFQKDTPFSSQQDRLLDKLRRWRMTRPTELKEIMAIDGYRDSFPTIIYSSGGSMSTNILYHTAMFLLLRQRPKAVDDFRQAREARDHDEQMYPLFHARQACGIVLNSEIKISNFWDPCTIAALSLLTRHVAQIAKPAETAKIVTSVEASGWPIGQLFTF